MNNQETLKEEMRTNFTQVMENAKELFYMTTETYTAFDQERTRYITHKPTTQQALEMLKVVGVTTLEIRFYGGHDNGDVEEISVYIDRDNFTHEFAYKDLFSDIDIGYQKKQGERPDHDFCRKNIRFEEALVDPIWSKYGSFAGDFSVSGVLKYDCVNSTVTLSGEESAYVGFGPQDCLDDEFDERGMRAFAEMFAKGLTNGSVLSKGPVVEKEEE